MKSLLLAGAAFALTAGAAVAQDEAAMASPELTAACDQINADNPALTAECSCLAEKASADETIMSDLLAYEGMASLEDASVTAINECGASLEDGEAMEDIDATEGEDNTY